MKMRGTIKPDPVYPQDIPGLLAWLNQPPSQWSAVGWQNAPVWAALVDKLISDLREAQDEVGDLLAANDADAQTAASLLYTIALIREKTGLGDGAMLAELPACMKRFLDQRDEARREVCYGYGSMEKALAAAKRRGWDCFDAKDEANP